MILSFKDKKGRNIKIYKEDYSQDIIAVHKQKEIGRFEFKYIDFEDSIGRKYGIDFELLNMKVVDDYTRSGIGSKLMEAAVKYYQDFKLPASHMGSRNTRPPNFLTVEGAALINYCFEKNILPKKFHNYIKRTS